MRADELKAWGHELGKLSPAQRAFTALHSNNIPPLRFSNDLQVVIK